jgi:hypothetical protein
MVVGVGTPLFLSTSVLNIWILLLPADVLGLLSPQRWLAPVLGAAWAAVVIFGLGGLASAANDLPVDFLAALGNLGTPIMFLFSLSPALAVVYQFGRLKGGAVFAASVLALVLTVQFLPDLFVGTFALLTGVSFLIAFALHKDFVARRSISEEDRRALLETSSNPFFLQNARRIRNHLPYLVVLGALLAAMSNLGIYAAGEATSFVIQQEEFAAAAQIDFYRALGFIPMVTTTALASGAYSMVGFSLLNAFGYVAPNVGTAAAGGALLMVVEVYLLIYVARALSALPSVRDASDYLRNAAIETVALAMLFGSILAGSEMAGGVGIAIVGGLVLLNEAMGKPIVRLAAGPTAVIIAGLVLNVLAYLQLLAPFGVG